jgi:septum formation protein
MVTWLSEHEVTPQSAQVFTLGTTPATTGLTSSIRHSLTGVAEMFDYTSGMARMGESLPSVVLASASPRRSELLSHLPVEFTVIASDAAEVHNEQLTVREICQINAYRKARVVAKKFPDQLVLGADTLVAMGNRLYGKPADVNEAERMLSELQGKTHEVVTGVCLMHLRRHRVKTFCETTWVTFKNLKPEDIHDYVSKVATLDKAGAYGIQEFGDMLVAGVDGSYDNVVGLPTESLLRALAEWRA